MRNYVEKGRRKMKIYISGKITGNPNAEKEFSEAKEFLKSRGQIVLNPMDLPQGMTRAEYMRINFAMIDVCDAVVYLDNYIDSDGAMLEKTYCKYIEKPLIRLETWAEICD